MQDLVIPKHTTNEFNDEVKLVIDDTISTVVGPQVLEAVYDHLKEHYDVTENEIPYRLDTLFNTLEWVFGFKGALTISRVIARRIYVRMGLRFIELPNYRVQDYLEQAKKELVLLPYSRRNGK
jgi:hypothetical protein